MKNQLNQNPADVTNQMQDENSESLKKEADKTKKTKKLPVEDQEENSKKKKTKTVKAAKKTKDAVKDTGIEPDKKSPAPEVKDKPAKKTKKKSETDQADQKPKVVTKEKKAKKKPEAKSDIVKPEETPGLAENENKEIISAENEPGLSSVIAESEPETLFQDEESTTILEEEIEEEEEDEAEGNVAILHLNRQELVELMEETIKENDINIIRKKVALIKVTFLKINKEEQHKKYEDFISSGQDKADFDSSEDELEKRFNAAFAVYKDKRQVFLNEQENLKHKNLVAKKIILEELKSLIDSEESLKKTYDEFKTLQEKWKEIGMVPKNEVNNLWQSYHFLVERFFDKVKINKELRDLDLRKNLESKIELCEKTEELLLESSILKSFKQLQKYHQQWKEIGPVPQDKKDEIWERFKNATDKINQRRREHYEKLQESHENNHLAKTALCEKAEDILHLENNTIKDWQQNTDQITELLKVWKTIGPAPRKQNDEIWDRFKSSLDTFFAGKKEYFQKIKEEQLNNYNLKLDLCAQSEALKTSTDWRKTTQELIRLQNEWRNIGPVPRKLSDKIWKRFRAACDEFFNAKSTFFSNVGKTEAENLKLKEDLIKTVEEFAFGEDKTANLDTLKGFQRDWTEIGHVPIKEKERLQNAFRIVINKQLDKLKISKTEIQNINYRNRIEGLKDTPNSDKIMGNERVMLMNKKKKIEEEIKLWENNIGFLSKSKKAVQVREEFEKKIENAKQEVVTLNDKIKFLDKEMK
jgi:hypothetical protein